MGVVDPLLPLMDKLRTMSHPFQHLTEPMFLANDKLSKLMPVHFPFSLPDFDGPRLRLTREFEEARERERLAKQRERQAEDKTRQAQLETAAGVRELAASSKLQNRRQWRIAIVAAIIGAVVGSVVTVGLSDIASRRTKSGNVPGDPALLPPVVQQVAQPTPMQCLPDSRQEP